MTLIKLKLDKNNFVVASGWANPKQRSAGDVTDDGFKVYDIDQAEIDSLIVGHTTLSDGHLVVDPDYTPPAEDIEPLEPSEQEAINATLTKKLAETAKTAALAERAVAELTKKLAELQNKEEE